MKGITTVQAPSLVTSPGSGPLVTPSPSQFLAAPVAFRYKNALLRRCRIKCVDFKSSSIVACNFQATCVKRIWEPLSIVSMYLLLDVIVSDLTTQDLSVAGNSFRELRSASTSFTLSDRGSLSLEVSSLRHTRRSTIIAQAYKDPFSLSVLSGTEKPEWWWRTLSCIPYLLALQVSDTGFYLQRFIDNFGLFENAVFYIPGAVNRLPTWFPMLYCYLAYNGIVNNKDWPLFFRFHVIVGILLEISLQLIWQSSNFLPFVHYNGALGMYYWAGVGVAYILIISECIRCALSGRYVRIPFLCKSATLHAVLGLGAYQLPF